MALKFNDLLNQYINEIGITAKELSTLSELGNATISRYRNGERIPNDVEKVKKLVHALCVASSNKYDEEQLFVQFLESTQLQASQDFSYKFASLLDTLDIKSSKLAKYMNYNPSMISRIRSNERRPIDINSFVDLFVSYISEVKNSSENKLKVCSLLELDSNKKELILYDDELYSNELRNWLLVNNSIKKKNLSSNKLDPSSYLNKLDEFNLDDYIEAIHFNDIKIPNISFQTLTTKTYVGIKEIREAEIDFLKSTVISKSMEPLYMCCDMPMEDMVKDKDFSKKWMFGLAMALKKGLPINIIHNLDRPFNELMLGLESWIPLYMTGLVRPYYMPYDQNKVYGHLYYSSGEVAMVGECIVGHHDEAQYYLTRKKAEVELYKRYSAQLLEKALPLMKIFTSDKENELHSFLGNRNNYSKKLIHKYTVPGIYTMSEELLIKILKRNDLSIKEIEKVVNYRKELLAGIQEYLKENIIIDYFYEYASEDFKDEKIELNIAEAFTNKKVSYSYEEYLEHLALNKKFNESYENYNYFIENKKEFKGIQFTIAKGKWVLISKGTHPNICFLVMHPILRDAIENMKMAIIE